MSEPITMYRDGDEVLTVYAPTWANELQAQGWRMEKDFASWMNDMENQAQDYLSDDVPFSFHDEYDTTVRNPPFIEDEPAPKPRRGRKPKAKP